MKPTKSRLVTYKDVLTGSYPLCEPICLSSIPTIVLLYKNRMKFEPSLENQTNFGRGYFFSEQPRHQNAGLECVDRQFDNSSVIHKRIKGAEQFYHLGFSMAKANLIS